MRLIDSNVLIYANGGEHEYREPSLRLLGECITGRILANIDVEALQEVLHFYRSRRVVETGVAVFNDVVEQFPQPLDVRVQTMKTAAEVLAAHPGIQSRDAVHAAVVIENRLEGIISADRAFDEITGIKRFDPKEF